MFQVYLIPNGQENNANEVGNEDLEIDEVNPDESFVEENNINMIRLTSKTVKKEPYSLERYTCPLWIQGLERSFKVCAKQGCRSLLKCGGAWGNLGVPIPPKNANFWVLFHFYVTMF